MEMIEDQPNDVLSKRLKIDETIEENREEEDRISALPDFLILQILSFLPSTKDAITTGKLSKRWKSLWTLIPTLTFKHNRYYQPASDFVSFVNKTLIQCGHSKLNKFELHIRYDIRLKYQINDWIHYAVSRKVEELDLRFCTFRPENMCVLEEQFFMNAYFIDLKLEGFIFNSNGAISWKMLRRLRITRANLDEDMIEKVLSGSPVLENLELWDCYGYKRLHITSKSVKKLVFCGYRNPSDDGYHVDVIEINAPNILSLKIVGELCLWKLLLVDLSSLVQAELNYTKYGYCETTGDEAKEEVLKGLIQSLHDVKELNIGIFCYKVLSHLKAKGFSSPASIQRFLIWK